MNNFWIMRPVLPIALGILLSACGGGGGDGDSASSTTVNSVVSNSANATVGNINAPGGARVLAAQCFQCHGTDGRSSSGIEGLAGESASELVEDMLEMKYSTNTDDIMHRQAMGYSEAQIRAIATYIAALPRK